MKDVAQGTLENTILAMQTESRGQSTGLIQLGSRTLDFLEWNEQYILAMPLPNPKRPFFVVFDRVVFFKFIHAGVFPLST